MKNKLPDVDNSLLELTTRTRTDLINQMMPNGVAPTDAKDIRNILTALKDIDAQQLKIAQIHAEDANAEEDREVALKMAKVSQQFGTQNPFERKVPVDADAAQLPEADIVDGEFDTEPGTGKFDEFISRVEDSDGRYIGEDADEE